MEGASITALPQMNWMVALSVMLAGVILLSGTADASEAESAPVWVSNSV
jgi:hypothetical protein